MSECICRHAAMMCSVVYKSVSEDRCGRCKAQRAAAAAGTRVKHHHAHAPGCVHGRPNFDGRTHSDYNIAQRDKEPKIPKISKAEQVAVSHETQRQAQSRMFAAPRRPGPVLDTQSTQIARSAKGASSAAVVSASASAAPSATRLIYGCSHTLSHEIRKYTTEVLPQINHATGKLRGDCTAFHARNSVIPMLLCPMDINLCGDVKPDVDAHANRGRRILFLRWELMYAGNQEVCNALNCPGCGTSLLGKSGGRWSTGTDAPFKALLSFNERPVFVASFVYPVCQGPRDGAACGRITRSTDAALLQQLPRRYARVLDVDPSWMNDKHKSHIFLSRSITDMAIQDLVSHEGLETFNSKMRGSMAKLYENARVDYFETLQAYYMTHPTDMSRGDRFPTMNEWLGRSQGVPGSDVLRSAFLHHFYDPNSVRIGSEMMSVNILLTRELQGVTAEGSSSGDHTFAAASLFNDPAIKQQYNVVTNTMECAGAYLTSTTSISVLLHALENLAHREGFHPSTMYLDTWPSDKAVWEALFIGCRGRLDIFHVTQRISKTLLDSHEDFGAALRALSNAIWVRNDADVKAVEAVLRQGNMSRRSKPMSDEEIQELHNNGKFMRRFRKWIDSHTKSKPDIEAALRLWITTFSNRKSTKSGLNLFNQKTVSTVEQQIGHIDDFLDTDSVSLRHQKKQGETHTLVQKSADRGSKAETFHTKSGSWTQGSCESSLAHAVAMYGTTSWNQDRHAAADFAKSKATSHQVQQYDIGLRRHANVVAEQARVPRPHVDLLSRKLKPDNGERFLFDHFKQQGVRDSIRAAGGSER